MTLVHASCICLASAGKAFGADPKAGVLILGASGAGKSTLALDLIAAGAKLVADDQVELFVRGGRIVARAPANIAGFLEVRGLGIVEIPYLRTAKIALAVRLGAKQPPRLPHHGVYEPPTSLLISRAKWPPMLLLGRSETSAPAKVALAVAAFENGLFRDRARGA